jgi:hypothetical protein
VNEQQQVFLLGRKNEVSRQLVVVVCETKNIKLSNLIIKTYSKSHRVLLFNVVVDGHGVARYKLRLMLLLFIRKETNEKKMKNLSLYSPMLINTF